VFRLWYVGHGAHVAIRRAALLEGGGFDQLLGAGGHFGACVDLDMTYRLLLGGWGGVYTGQALDHGKSGTLAVTPPRPNNGALSDGPSGGELPRRCRCRRSF